MADNLKEIPFDSKYEGMDIPDLVKTIVYDQACALGARAEDITFNRGDVYIVCFADALGAWRALCSTRLSDVLYYEVTFNKKKGVAYVDTYSKTHTIEVNITHEKDLT